MTAGSPASGGGTFGVANGSGYPTANFVVVIDRGLSTEEKIFCSSRSANVLTVGTSGRGFDGTAAASHSNGATLEHELDAAVITALLEHVNANAGDDHSMYLNTARHDVTARHTFGAALGTPAAGADIATAGAAGSGASPARSDHVHKIGAGAINSAGMLAAGVVAAAALDAAVYGGAPANVGTSPSAGAASTLSRSDHVHDLGNGSINDPTLFTAGVVDLAAIGTTVDSLLPWLVDIDVFMTPISQVNWNTLVVDTTAIHQGEIQSTGVQNAEINWDVVLGAGTWTLELMYVRGSAGGIFTVTVGAVSAGTVDSYNASLAPNIRTALTAIATPTTGKYRVKLKMATKNGSSSNYFGTLQHVQLRRTA